MTFIEVLAELNENRLKCFVTLDKTTGDVFKAKISGETVFIGDEFGTVGDIPLYLFDLEWYEVIHHGE